MYPLFLRFFFPIGSYRVSSFIIFYWSIITFQCCVSFYYIQQISSMYVCIPSLLVSRSHQILTFSGCTERSKQLWHGQVGASFGSLEVRCSFAHRRIYRWTQPWGGEHIADSHLKGKASPVLSPGKWCVFYGVSLLWHLSWASPCEPLQIQSSPNVSFVKPVTLILIFKLCLDSWLFTLRII